MVNNLIKYSRYVFTTLKHLIKGGESITNGVKISIKHRYIATLLILFFSAISVSIFVIFYPTGMLNGFSAISNQEGILGKIWISLMLIINIAIGIYFSTCSIYLVCKIVIKTFGDK